MNSFVLKWSNLICDSIIERTHNVDITKEKIGFTIRFITYLDDICKLNFSHVSSIIGQQSVLGEKPPEQ